MRHTALLLLLCSCSSLSTAEAEQLALYQRNAKLYWEGDHLSQALGQIQLGLNLAPDDYLLNTLRGAILLRESGPSQGLEHQQLDEATAILARVYDTRWPGRHEPALLFNYALARQKQARRQLGEARRLAATPDDTNGRSTAAQIAEHRRLAEQQFDEAEEVFQVLIERGEVLRLCYKSLLIAAQDRGNDQAMAKYAKDYLEQVAKEEAYHQAEIDRTNEPGYEKDQKELLDQLLQEELGVRSLLAQHSYLRKKYDVALTMLNRILVLDPKRSTDYYNRGRVLQHLGREQEAKVDFRKFLATTDLPPSDQKTIFAASTLSK